MIRAFSAALLLLLVPVLNGQDNADPFAREAAISKAWAILRSTLSAGDLQGQLAAVSALTMADTPDALELFERLAQRGTEPVRNTALSYLPATSNRDYLPLVADALNDPSLSVRREAIQRLAFFHDGRAVKLLQDVIARHDADTIEWATGSARNLGSLGIDALLSGADSADDRMALPSLRTLEVLLDPTVSSAASDNLVALRGRRPEAVLTRALQHVSPPEKPAKAAIIELLTQCCQEDTAIVLSRRGDARRDTRRQ